MLEGVLDLLGTGGLGAVFGTIAGSVSKYANQRLELKKSDLEMQHAYNMAKLQNEHDELMAKQKLLEKEQEGRWRDSGKNWDAIIASITAETSLHTGVSQHVADARAMFRMRLTVGLWVAVVITIPLSFYFAGPYMERIVESLVFTATSAGAMWFGAKAVTSRHQ